MVHLSNRVVRIPSPLTAALQSCCVLDKESASKGTISIEGDLQLSKERQERGIIMSRYRVVIALVHLWQDEATFLSKLIYLFDLFWGEVRKTELGWSTQAIEAGVARTYLNFPSLYS